jgi:hypothetical protein
MSEHRRQQSKDDGAASAAPSVRQAERDYRADRGELLSKRYCEGRLKLAPVVGILQLRQIRAAIVEIRGAVGKAMPTGNALSIDALIDLAADAVTDYAPRLYEYILVPADSRGWRPETMAETAAIIEAHNLDIEEMMEAKDDFFALHPRAIATVRDLWRKLCLGGVTLGEMASKAMTLLSMSSTSAPASQAETPSATTGSSIPIIPIIPASPSPGQTSAETSGTEPTPPPSISTE